MKTMSTEGSRENECVPARESDENAETEGKEENGRSLEKGGRGEKEEKKESSQRGHVPFMTMRALHGVH